MFIKNYFQQIHEPLSKSKEKDRKIFKFDLVKVVNTQVNAISDESPKHLLEKILKLHALLTEKEVLFSGKKVSTKGDKTALVSVMFKYLFWFYLSFIYYISRLEAFSRKVV